MKKITQLLLIIFFSNLPISHNLLATETINSGDPETYRSEEYRLQWGLEAIKAADAYAFLARNNKPVAGDDVIVGISDCGLVDHPDPEFMTNNTNIYFNNEKFPVKTHGSFVTSVAVAVKNDSNTHGVAYNAKFMTGQMVSADHMYNIDGNRDGRYWLTNNNVHLLSEDGAKVINMSWSITHEVEPLDEENHQFLAFKDDISQTLKQDTLIAIAAGNSRSNFIGIESHKLPDGTIRIINFIDPAIYISTEQYRSDFNIPDDQKIEFANPNGKINTVTEYLVTDHNISNGKIIIVAATSQNGEMAGFSDLCGDLKDFCMVAPGVGINATTLNKYHLVDGNLVDLNRKRIDPALIANLKRDEDGTYFVSKLVSGHGTSYAAPHVTGAAAVLRGAWPQLNAETTVQILLNTATDLGAPGVDEIYGHGMLNLFAAVQPQGQTIIPSSDNVNDGNAKGYLSSSTAITSNGGFGDAYERMAPILKQAIFVDMYGRDYLANLDQRMSRSKDSVHKLQNILIMNPRNFKTIPISFGNNYSSKITMKFANQDDSGVVNRYSIFKGKDAQCLTIDHSKPDLANHDVVDERTISFSYENNFNNNLKLGFAINNSDFSLENNIAKNFNFISSTDFVVLSPYQNLASNRFLGNRRDNQVSSNRFLATYKFNEIWNSNFSYINNNSNNFAIGSISNNEIQSRIFDSGITRKIGSNGQISLNYGNMQEFNNNFLGAKNTGAFSNRSNPVTNYARIGYIHKLSNSWNFITSYSEGVTKIAGNRMGIFRNFSDIRSRSFSAGLLNENIFGGKLGIVYSEPLRYRGSANIIVPTGVDQNGNVIRLNSKVSLAPSGKEKDFEVYYGLDLNTDSNISLNLSLQDDVNNVKDQMGYLGLVRYRIKF
jgi:subtilisin family serine protease